MSSFSLAQIILILSPFAFFSVLGLTLYIKNERKKARLSQVMKSATLSMEEKNITRLLEKGNQKPSFIQKQNSKMNIIGIEYKFETLIMAAAALFIIGCILAVTIFKSGIILMIYLGILSGASVFIWLNSLIEKKRQALTLEFLEKMRDVTTYLSIGKNLDNALYEALTQGNISKIMYKELDIVRQDIYIHQKASEAFMAMYERLQIEDIKMYAETLAVFEQSGGNLITVMKANDRFATNKIEIRNAQEVFIKGQKTSQKFVIGFPLAMIVFMFIVNPSFFGNFYSTLEGQAIAIVCITVLVAGVMLSNKIAQLN